MADSIIITSNVTDGAVITSNVSEATVVTANVVTGAKGDKGETGDTGPAGADAPSDHTLLTSIGTNTHAQIDTAISDSVSHIANTSNPHIVTKAQVGLSNVPNTDLTAAVAANTAKISYTDAAKVAGIEAGAQVNTVTSVNTRTGAVTGLAEASDLTAHTGNTSNPHSVTKAQVGLGNVDNTADANKPVSTATQMALDGKFTQRTITGTTNQITVTDGDGVSGNPTLALPQSIHTGASPTFDNLTLTTYGGIYNGAQKVFEIGSWGTPTNGLGMEAAPTGNGATLYTTGGDTNIDLSLTTKGSGAISANANTHPGVDSTYTLGTSSLYWSNTYTDRLYLNSTAYFDGGTAGTANLTGALGILATSGSATHSLTLGSTSTGIALYNTSDQTTNYERTLIRYVSNELRIGGGWGGSGGVRVINISAFDSVACGIRLNSSSVNGIVQSIFTTSTSGSITSLINGTLSATFGTQYLQSIAPIINQTSTAGYTALLINPTETATGSGAKNLIDAQVGGVSKFKVTNGGMPELGVTGEGIVMKSPDGTRYKVTVANGGTIAVAAA